MSFVPASTSDNLTFSVDVDETVKIKITIMVGDGLNEVIYGTRMLCFSMEELRQKQEISFKDSKFYNFAQTQVGKCNLTFQMIK